MCSVESECFRENEFVQMFDSIPNEAQNFFKYIQKRLKTFLFNNMK
jgi:hypothetical protein